MHSEVGVFKTWEAAQRAADSLGLAKDQFSVIAADQREPEETGIGGPLGGAVGGAIGAATGSTLGVLAASMAVPGVGPVVATGVVAALVLGAGGAAVGAVAGDKAEQAAEVRPSTRDSFFMAEALRRGRVVVIALAKSPEQAAAIRSELAAHGAEDLDKIREAWWRSLRQAESGAYGSGFDRDEAAYREGFEAALEPANRGKPLDEGAEVPAAYRRGYDRGLQYYEKVVDASRL
ncbi:MAG: hypothetical protein KIT09_34275 [Bryobacteraceae bacterium]|nr:hypothetical protein [Bryobacteraceae bacterium]